MKHTEIDRYITCDICWRKMYYTNKFTRFMRKCSRLKFLNIKKYYLWPFKIVWQLLWDEQDIDICDWCCESLKWHLEYLSRKCDPVKTEKL